MRQGTIAQWTLAGFMTLAAMQGMAQQDDGPILRPHKPAAKPAAVSATLLVTCDLACNWKLDGVAQGHIEAEGSAKTKVELGQHVFSAATEDGLDKVTDDIEIKTTAQSVHHVALQSVREARTKAEPQAKDKADAEAKNKAANDAREKAEQGARDKALNAQAWVDPATGLMWTRKDNGTGLSPQQATDYCRNLQLAGRSDWRLPTIDELQGIYDKNAYDHGYHVKGNLQLSMWWEWGESNNHDTALGFIDGREERATYLHGPNGYYPHALCVRISGQDTAASARAQSGDAAGAWIDPATGLMWAKKDNGDNNDLTWTQADAYCKNLRLDSYSDWRLPTIDELQSIYDPSVSQPISCCNNHGGWQGDLHIKGNLQLSGWLWSGTQGNDSGKAWAFVFYGGERYSSPLDYSNYRRALCVRRSGE
jgi:hypothetical protein